MRRFDPCPRRTGMCTAIAVSAVSLAGTIFVLRAVDSVSPHGISISVGATAIFEQRPIQVRSLGILIIPSRQPLHDRCHPARSTATAPSPSTTIFQEENTE
jgi:hypothetical protein